LPTIGYWPIDTMTRTKTVEIITYVFKIYKIVKQKLVQQ